MGRGVADVEGPSSLVKTKEKGEVIRKVVLRTTKPTPF